MLALLLFSLLFKTSKMKWKCKENYSREMRKSQLESMYKRPYTDRSGPEIWLWALYCLVFARVKRQTIIRVNNFIILSQNNCAQDRHIFWQLKFWDLERLFPQWIHIKGNLFDPIACHDKSNSESVIAFS